MIAYFFLLLRFSAMVEATAPPKATVKAAIHIISAGLSPVEGLLRLPRTAKSEPLLAPSTAASVPLIATLLAPNTVPEGVAVGLSCSGVGTGSSPGVGVGSSPGVGVG